MLSKKKADSTFVPSWLVAGSFEKPGATSVLSFPFLVEEDLAPSVREKLGDKGWSRVEPGSRFVDLLAQDFRVKTNCAAYAFTYVHAKDAGAAKLLVGSDDGVAVWLNGERVWFNDVQRGHTAGEDVVKVRFSKGWNRLLLKISQFLAGWGFSCAIDAKTKLRFALDNPSRKKFPGPKAPGLALGVAEIEPGTSTSRCRVLVNVTNQGARGLKDVSVQLRTAAGDAIASAEMASIPAVDSATVGLDIDTKALAVALGSSEGGTVVEAKAGRATATVPVPAEAAVGLLIDGARRTDSQAGRSLDRVIGAFGAASAAHASVVREAFAALGAGDQDAFERKLAELKEALLAGVPDRKGDTAWLVGHAHIDMNWLWTWRETVQSCQDTFRQAVAFMREFPDFRFSQSQPSCYQAVEATDPELFRRIADMVREGRWELLGGMLTEGDTNLSGGEALARSFLLGQRYFMDRFGKTARVGWLPDNFGHVSQLPQMLRLAGCESFYFHRCRPHLGSFWWDGTDGSRVLCYSNFTYNGDMTPGLTGEFDRIVPETKRLMHVYGVGDHGGGPVREHVENAIRLDETPHFPTLRFATAGEFFDNEAPLATDRPVHLGEMQFTFDGCYTTVTRVKEGNRRCESALYGAEFAASLRKIAGDAYPADDFRRAWEIVAFNQFHDILCGSAIHEANAEAVADYKWARSRAEFERTKALRALADEVRTDSLLGTPVVVLNTQPRRRTQMVEVEAFSYDKPIGADLVSWSDYYGARHAKAHGGPGAAAGIMLCDHGGRPIPAQIVGGQSFPPGWRTRVQFLAENLPAGGYRTYYVDPANAGEFNEPFAPNGKGELKTDALDVTFDMKTGEIRRLVDRRTGRELVSVRGARKGGANRLRIYIEQAHGMNAWVIGKTQATHDLTEAEYVRVTESGPVRTCVEALKRWGHSKFVQRTYVYRSYPRIDFELEAHWFEVGEHGKPHPLLRVVFPLTFRDPRFDCHVPFDVVARPTDGTEVPAQQWVDVTDGEAGVALLNETKYGHSFVEDGGKKGGGELRLTLLRACDDPDRYPDQGMHFIRYSLFPHAGDWKSGVWAEGEAVNVPALSTEPPSASLRPKEPSRPAEDSFVALEPPMLVLSGLKEAEEGGELVARIVEVEGAETDAVLTLPVEVKSARRLDLIERPLEGVPAPAVDGRTVRVKVRAHEVVTVGIAL
jgi:alpha-mannosidase